MPDEYTFCKKRPDDKVWWVETVNGEAPIGFFGFSFDKKTVFRLFSDYPSRLTAEQKVIFDAENPFWANHFKKF